MAQITKRDIELGVVFLSEQDGEFASAVEHYGRPEPRVKSAGFEAFVEAIVSQQISKQAAASIFSKVEALTPDFNPIDLLKLSVNDLRGAGLSQRKAEYTLGLAKAVVDGSLDVEALSDMSDSEAIKAITTLRGFGRWSAEIYLMFSLGRPDIFPADDLAIQIALTRLKCPPGSERLKPKQARDLTEHWSPWRSVGSLFLWHYYATAPM